MSSIKNLPWHSVRGDHKFISLFRVQRFSYGLHVFLGQIVAKLQEQEHGQVHHERDDGRDGIDAVVDGGFLLDHAFGGIVSDGCHSHGRADAGQGLPQFAEEGEAGVGGGFTSVVVLHLVVVDDICDHSPDFQGEEGQAEAAQQDHEQEHIRIVGLDKEQDQERDRRDQAAEGADLLLAELLYELAHERHERQHRDVVEDRYQGEHAGLFEVVFEQVVEDCLGVHAARDQEHGRQAQHHERSVLGQFLHAIQGIMTVLMMLRRNILPGQLKEREVDDDAEARQHDDTGHELAGVQVLGTRLGHGRIHEQRQQDLARRGAEARSQGADHGQCGALFQIIGHGGGHGPVRDIDRRVQHAVQNICHISID